MISILDYGSGNISAFSHIYKKSNIPHKIVSSAEELKDATKIILPGVGAFDIVMASLDRSGMRELLDELVLEKEVPILGVCVGMQIMAEASDEGTEKGLSWIKGSVKKIDTTTLQHKPTTPHMGWNDITIKKPNHIFDNIDNRKGFYFLHSYYFACANKDEVLATVNYGTDLPCAVHINNIYGFQFHPEKSHSNGVALLQNFAGL